MITRVKERLQRWRRETRRSVGENGTLPVSLTTAVEKFAPKRVRAREVYEPENSPSKRETALSRTPKKVCVIALVVQFVIVDTLSIGIRQ